MSTFQTTQKLPVLPTEAMAACRAAVAQLRWKVEVQSDRRLVCKEQAPALGSFTTPAKFEIDLHEVTGGTLVDVIVSNLGFGPFKSNYVKGQAGAFCNQLLVVLDRSQTAPQVPSQPAASLSSELQNLASLRDRGVLSDAEFEAAKAKLLAS